MLKWPPEDIHLNLNQHISYLCKASLGTDNQQNHCAHFVSHIMKYELPGTTCKNLTLKDKQTVEEGATIRVNDIFNKTLTNGLWDSKPGHINSCLIFVTISNNIIDSGGNLTMRNHKKKHIGIVSKGKVWNYSNSEGKVVADTIKQFIRKFKHAYITAGNTVNFYYGSFLCG